MAQSLMTITSDVSVDQTAYELSMDYALRSELHFDGCADVKSTNPSMNGPVITWTITSDLSAQTTALNESTDLTPFAMADTQPSVTLTEFGNAVKTSAKVRGSSFLEYDPVVANVVTYNAALSIDTIARDVLKAGSNVRYSTGTGAAPAGRTSVTPLNTIRAVDVRRARVDLRQGLAQKVQSGLYLAFINPDVLFDLQSETGSGSWLTPHEYSQPENIWTAAAGDFLGFRFIETDRAPVFADGGSSATTTDVYATLFLGQQALAKGHSHMDGNGPMPRLINGPVTDTLARFRPFGWYWFGNYGRYREACLRRVESASSIGAN